MAPPGITIPKPAFAFPARLYDEPVPSATPQKQQIERDLQTTFCMRAAAQTPTSAHTHTQYPWDMGNPTVPAPIIPATPPDSRLPYYIEKPTKLPPVTAPPVTTHHGPTPRRNARCTPCACCADEGSSAILPESSYLQASKASAARFGKMNEHSWSGYTRFPQIATLTPVVKYSSPQNDSEKEETVDLPTPVAHLETGDRLAGVQERDVYLPLVPMGVVSGLPKTFQDEDASSTSNEESQKHAQNRAPMHIGPTDILPAGSFSTTEITTNQSVNGSGPYKFDFDLPDVSTAALVALITIIVLAALWQTLLYFVNFPPAYLTRGRKGRTAGNGWLLAWLAGKRRAPKKLKPIDKPSKYVRIPDEPSSAMSTATGLRLDDQARPRGVKQRTASSNVALPTGFSAIPRPLETDSPAHRRAVSMPTTAIPRPSSPPFGQNEDDIPLGSLTPKASGRSSTNGNTLVDDPPPNPFLRSNPTLPTRTSEEWLAEREAFLSRNRSHSPDLSRSSSINFDEESQMRPSTPYSAFFPPNPLGRYLGNGRGGGYGGEREYESNGTWLDSIDGAVNRVVNGMARWTEDERDGEEVLPVSKKVV